MQTKNTSPTDYDAIIANMLKAYGRARLAVLPHCGLTPCPDCDRSHKLLLDAEKYMDKAINLLEREDMTRFDKGGTE